jgi:hypothetical protein
MYVGMLHRASKAVSKEKRDQLTKGEKELEIEEHKDFLNRKDGVIPELNKVFVPDFRAEIIFKKALLIGFKIEEVIFNETKTQSS